MTSTAPSALNVVFFGPPGAGKGTQADRFCARHGIPKISTGEILRSAVQEGSALGVLVEETLRTGALVSDALMIDVVRERLDRPDTAAGFVLDGFPRTVAQAEALDAMMAGRGPLAVIALEVSPEVLVRRLSTRGRSDDEDGVILERLRIYVSDTAPVLDYYRRRRMIAVRDGDQSADAVAASIEAITSRAHQDGGRLEAISSTVGAACRIPLATGVSATNEKYLARGPGIQPGQTRPFF